MTATSDQSTADARRRRWRSWAAGMSVRRGLLAAVAAGVAAALLTPAAAGTSLRLLLGWDVLLYVAIAAQWTIILRSNPDVCRLRSRADDPGDVGVFLIVVGASLASLLAAVIVIADPARRAGAELSQFLPALAILAVIGGWILMQSAFTLHYARLYYGDDETPGGGMTFSGGPPDDLDFAYFAFGIGTAFQVSDVPVTTKIVRRTVLLHSVLSFAYSTAILALMINIVAGHLN